MPRRIELAKASVGDIESWLKDADAIKGDVCPFSKPPPVKVAPVEKKQPVARATTEDSERPKAQRAPSESRSAPGNSEACLNTCHAAGRQSLGPEALQPPLRGRLAPDARPAKPARPWRRRGSARG